MIKLRIATTITSLLGLVSLGWIIYDYIMIAAYSTQENPFGDWKMVSLGFVPIILFHFSFFITAYILFDFLKNQKPVIKENAKLRTENLKLKTDLHVREDASLFKSQKNDELKSDKDKNDDEPNRHDDPLMH